MVPEEVVVVKRILGKDLNTQCVHLEMGRVFLAVSGCKSFPEEIPQGEQQEMTHKEEWGQEVLLKLPKAMKETHKQSAISNCSL